MRTDIRPYNTPVSLSMGAGMDAAAQGHRGSWGDRCEFWLRKRLHIRLQLATVFGGSLL